VYTHPNTANTMESVPIEEARVPTEVPSTSITASHATTERLVEGLVSEGHSLLSAGRPGAGVPSMMGTHDTQVSSDQTGATLRPLLANPPHESSDVNATLDVAEIPDPEAEPTLMLGLSLVPPSWMRRGFR